jgi:hypothetical protein
MKEKEMSHNATRRNTPLIIGVLIALVMVFGAIALVSTMISSNNSSDTAPNVKGTHATSVALPMIELDGEWTAEINDLRFDATVRDDSIAIRLVNGPSSMLYWNGTFKTQGSNGDTIVSDKVETNDMIMSQADSKEFVVGFNTLSFEFKAMGVTTNVVLNNA